LLIKVFSEYGHIVCIEITIGEILCTANQFVTQKEFCQKWTVSKDCVKTMLVNLLEKFNMDVPNKLIAHYHSVNLNEIETWLNDISKKKSLWSLANQPVLFPLYKILDDKYKRQIENILKNKQKILITGVTKLSSHKICYYRVNFDNYLTSNDYQVIGSVVKNNKRLDLNGFRSFWQLIGEPKAVGYFSNCTRNTKIFCEELKVEISSRKTSCRINIEDELSPGCIIATSVQYPLSNYEHIIQVFMKSWSGKQIDLDIINRSFDSLFIFVTVQLYVINPNQQESVIPDNTTIPKFNLRYDLTYEFKVYEVNKPKVRYVIKEYKYKTRDAFDRELRMLDELKNTENIIQLINNYPSQAIMVLEYAVYDLETFLSY
ncbi:8912_t:CDS:2, partial [Funneliformis mosseae]